MLDKREKQKEDLSIRPVYGWQYKDQVFKTRDEAESAFYGDKLKKLFPYISGFGYDPDSIANKASKIKEIFSTIPEVKAWPE